MNKKEIELYKILMLGDISVGKTTIVNNYTAGMSIGPLMQTVGIDLKTKTIVIDDKTIKLQIWDTAGQERFKAINRGMFRQTAGVMFVYDVTNPKSLDHIQAWLEEVTDNADEDVARLIVGNKSDLDLGVRVSFDAAQAFAADYGIDIMEVSAMTSENIEKAFELLARKTIKMKESEDTRKAIRARTLTAWNSKDVPNDKSCCS